MNILDRFYQLLGIGPTGRGGRRLDGVVDRPAVKFEPPGAVLRGLTSDDIDPDTGRAYPDYLERRLKRQAELKAQDENQVAGLLGDVRPL